MRKIVLFGAGRTGEKFVYRYYNEIAIHCFWDNKKTGELLRYSIEKPIFDRSYFIIVTSEAYLEIREQLINMGYCEFKDFIPFQIFQKKMAVAFGNCHMDTVKQYLERHREFSLEYGFYPFPTICEIQKYHLQYRNILEHCDLFLHQSIKKDNGYGEIYSSVCMLQYIRKTAKAISIPNLYGLPEYLFPQAFEPPSIASCSPFILDRNVVSWLENGKSEEEIVTSIIRGGVYLKEDIIKLWEKFKWKLLEREKEWDVKISDYILMCYRKDKLFSDIGHINSKTAKEIASRTIEYMGYKEEIHIELPILDAIEMMVYPDVKAVLGLEFDEKFIRKYTKWRCLEKYEMDMREYIKQLCQYTRYWLHYEEKYD